MIVEVRDNNLSEAVRVFKKKVKKAGLLAELRHRESYLKPSQAKKLKRQVAEKRRKKAAWRIAYRGERRVN